MIWFTAFWNAKLPDSFLKCEITRHCLHRENKFIKQISEFKIDMRMSTAEIAESCNFLMSFYLNLTKLLIFLLIHNSIFKLMYLNSKYINDFQTNYISEWLILLHEKNENCSNLINLKTLLTNTWHETLPDIVCLTTITSLNWLHKFKWVMDEYGEGYYARCLRNVEILCSTAELFQIKFLYWYLLYFYKNISFYKSFDFANQVMHYRQI